MNRVAPPDLPSLFPIGFHDMSLDEIERSCVEGFPLSRARPAIMAGLRDFVAMLQSSGVYGKIWGDGSFTTEKIDPKDVDVVLIYDAVSYDEGTDELRCAIDLVISNLKSSIKCDSYVCMQYPEDHPLHTEGKWWYAWYFKQWGFSREDEPKGIVVVSLDGVAP